MKDYRTIDIPADALVQRRELIGTRWPIGAIGVLRLPAGTADTVDLHFGEDGDPIPLVASLQSLFRSPPQSDGVYYSVRAAAPAGTKLLIVAGLGVALEGDPAAELVRIRQLLELMAKQSGVTLPWA